MRADARVFKKQDDRSDVNRIVSIDVPELGCQGDYVIFPGFCDVHVHLSRCQTSIPYRIIMNI